MRDRRHYKRFFVEGMGIHCRMKSGTQVNLLNLTPAGAYIMLTEKLELGREHTLLIEREGLSISAKGKVVSIDSAENELDQDGEFVSAYVTGIQFNTAFKEDSALLAFIRANVDNTAAIVEDKDLIVKVTATGSEHPYHGTYHINDISFGGMRIQSEKHMEVDSGLRMEIVVAMNKPTVRVKGRIASCKKIPASSPPRYNVGIEFTDIRKKDILALKDFIYFVQEL